MPHQDDSQNLESYKFRVASGQQLVLKCPKETG